jgi:anti-sigma B factor antagonist
MAATVAGMSVLEFSVNTAALGGDAFVVTLTGEIDLYTAPTLEQSLEGVVALGGTSVAVDLAEVTFIDSTTLEVLLRYHERFRGLGGVLVIVTDDRRVLRTFQITGLDSVFTIEHRLADAVATILPGL